MGAETLLLPVGAIVILSLAGFGAIGLLGPRWPYQVQAALAAPLAAAVIVCASPLALLHLSPAAVSIAALGPLVAVTLLRVRHVRCVGRRAATPIAIALFALALSAAPAIRTGSWIATSYGNGDPYLWVSQAQSLSEGPPPGPASTFPDRVSYDMLMRDHWPVGLPVGLGALASFGRVDPVDAYEAFAAVISALLALGVFGAARGVLRWSARLSAIAAALVAANGLMLLSTYFGWQAQLLITVFGTLAVLTLPAALDRRATARESVLPALFLAAGIATYGWVFAPFLGIAAAVSVVTWARPPRSSVGRRRIAGRLGGIGALALVLGLVPIIEALERYAVARGRVDGSVLRTWSNYDWGLPSDALGLIIRVGTQTSPGTVWTLTAVTAAAIALGTGSSRMRTVRNPRGYVLVTASAVVIGALGGLAAVSSSPYASLKLMGYAGPLLTLLALATFTRRSRATSAGAAGSLRHLGAVLFATVVGASFLSTSVFTVGYALKWLEPATEVSQLATAAGRLPNRDPIRIDYSDAWRQSWLVYFLRDRPLAVRHPSVYLTGFSPADIARRPRFDVAASFAIGPTGTGHVLWHGREGALYRIPGRPAQ